MMTNAEMKLLKVGDRIEITHYKDVQFKQSLMVTEIGKLGLWANSKKKDRFFRWADCRILKKLPA